MTGKTHMAGGALFGLMWIGVMHPDSYVKMGVMLGATTIGSLLPDIDHPRSRLSNTNLIFKAVSGVVSSFTKHRNEIHTVFACILFGILGYVLSILCGNLIENLMLNMGVRCHAASYALTIGLGFFIGSMCHLIWDTFNPEGIRWLYPSKKRISLGFITTGGVLETFFYIANCVLVCIVAFVLFKQGVFTK